MKNGVTICIPVYNEKAKIAETVRSALGQAARILISDNASTDGTSEICLDLAREFPEIKYHRHAENLGALRNWRTLLERVETPYLMFLGAHDRIDPDYVARVCPAFASGDDILAASGGLVFDYGDRQQLEKGFSRWTGGELDSPRDRVSAMLYSRVPVVWAIYGLLRTDAVRKYFGLAVKPFGFDVFFMANLLTDGKLKIVPGANYLAWMRQGKEPPARYMERIVANSQAASKRSLRNQFRIDQHEFMLKTCRPATALARLRYRLLSSIHFGVFNYPGLDLPFYLVFIPAKIARSLIRLRLKFDPDAA